MRYKDFLSDMLWDFEKALRADSRAYIAGDKAAMPDTMAKVHELRRTILGSAPEAEIRWILEDD